MSVVENLATELTNTLNSFEAARTRIAKDEMSSDQKKIVEQTALRDRVLLKTETLAVQLWGQIVTNADYSLALSPQGEIWAESARYEAALSNAKSSFERGRFVQPEMIENRAKTIVLNSRAGNIGMAPDKLFWELYTEASEDVQHYFKENNSALLEGKFTGSALVAARLERMRGDDLSAALLPTQTAINQFMGNVAIAYKASQRASHLFGYASAYLEKFLVGIDYRKTSKPTGASFSLDRKPIRAPIIINDKKTAALRFGRN